MTLPSTSPAVALAALGLVIVILGLAAIARRWQPSRWRGSSAWMFGTIVALLGLSLAVDAFSLTDAMGSTVSNILFACSMVIRGIAVVLALIAWRQIKQAGIGR